jgi:hypothetical protein
MLTGMIEHLFEPVKWRLVDGSRCYTPATGREHVFDHDEAAGGEMARTEPTRALSVRLPSDLFTDLELLARFKHVSLAQEVRLAVEQHLARQLSDDAFVKEVEHGLEDDLQGLKRLRYRHGAAGRGQPA